MSTITPSERLGNLESAARLKGDLGDEWVLLPDMSRLVVGFQCGAENLPLHDPPEVFTYKVVTDGKPRYIDRATASGLIAWKWSTPNKPDSLAP